MTEPRLSRRNHGKGHSYKLDGVKIPGVTTILNALPKQLTRWAAEQSANYALDHWDELATLPPSDRHKRIMWAHRETVKAAALRGTKIHALGDKLAHGEPVEVPDEHRAAVEGYARFLDEWQIEAVATECPVGHTRYRYAGTADLVGIVGRIDSSALMFLDLKSGRGVYDEAALQVAAYRHADLWQPDGPETEAPMPETAEGFVVHIGPDATRLLPVDSDADMFRGFLYVAEVSKLLRRLEDERPILPALELEDYS